MYVVSAQVLSSCSCMRVRAFLACQSFVPQIKAQLFQFVAQLFQRTLRGLSGVIGGAHVTDVLFGCVALQLQQSALLALLLRRVGFESL